MTHSSNSLQVLLEGDGGLCRHRQSIINSLQDTDISIRRRSLDLLFAMCNKKNVREIVAELLSYLQASPQAQPKWAALWMRSRLGCGLGVL